MGEGFELVRNVRLHLRRGATLLDQGHLDEALQEAESALALDAESLPAQALRERILKAKAASPSAAPLPADQAPPRAFVPHGVNAASWRGFEQRISERRFRALVQTINTSIVAGDAAAARAALEEARELKPDAPELPDLEARVAAVPLAPTAKEAAPAARIWMRGLGAAAMLALGVSLFIGLEWMRPSDTIVPAAAPTVPIVAPAEPPRRSETPPRPGPITITEDEESVPAIVIPPEPLLQPRGTTGATPAIETRPVAMRETPPPPIEAPVPATQARARISEEPPIQPVGETSDDYVARPVAGLGDAAPAIDTSPTPAPATRASEENSEPEVEALDTVAASVVPAAVVPAGAPPAAVTGPSEQSRVQEVLRRYARAYGELNASAARAVWPTVNEKALANAFQNLASQNVSFEACDIDIRGATANASCRGHQTYVGKVGSRDEKTQAALWKFELRRDGEAWKIQQAEMRRQSAGYRP